VARIGIFGAGYVGLVTGACFADLGHDVVVRDIVADRIAELQGIAAWLADWARQTADEFHQNLVCLGDFNIDREGDPNYEAFTSRGLRPPEELRGLPRTIFDQPEHSSFFDQIAWFHDDGEAKLTLEYGGRAGNFDFADLVFPELDREAKSCRVSDHFPLWTEFLAPRTP